MVRLAALRRVLGKRGSFRWARKSARVLKGSSKPKTNWIQVGRSYARKELGYGA